MDDFITSQRLAEELGFRPQTLRRWRSEGRGPRYIRFGDARRGRVRYARRDVAEWLADALTARPATDGIARPCPPGCEDA